MTKTRAGGRKGRVVGIGTDIVDVERMARSLERTRGFAASIFSEGERAYCEARARPAEHFAARFAAKEAFLKAVGRGVLEGIPLREIEVVREGDAAPRLALGPAAARALGEVGAEEALVTLSHAGGCAVAFVLVQR